MNRVPGQGPSLMQRYFQKRAHTTEQEDMEINEVITEDGISVRTALVIPSHPFLQAEELQEIIYIEDNPTKSERKRPLVPPTPPAQKQHKKKRRCADRALSSAMEVAQAAKACGMGTVMHHSGVEFAIPITVEAMSFTVPLNIPSPTQDLVSDIIGKPYCQICNSVCKSWRGYEYHVLSKHLKIKTFECEDCEKKFFVEEEGMYHRRVNHPNKPPMLLMSCTDGDKLRIQDAFSQMVILMRTGRNLSSKIIDDVRALALFDCASINNMIGGTIRVAIRGGITRDVRTQTPPPNLTHHASLQIFENPRLDIRFFETRYETILNEIDRPVSDLENLQQRFMVSVGTQAGPPKLLPHS